MATTDLISHDEKQMRFEIHEGDETVFLEFRFYKDKIALMHTVVPSSMEGRGVASALAQHAFAYAKEQHNTVMVYCSYVLSYLKRHTELSKRSDKENHATNNFLSIKKIIQSKWK
ncbi:hypothetical protein EMGBS15_17150 [Filimonas sp.]|jgi:hypothetical protein|nr:hypothetical protein EMGBS15_17150 [Filimonas sp.]